MLDLPVDEIKIPVRNFKGKNPAAGVPFQFQIPLLDLEAKLKATIEDFKKTRDYSNPAKPTKK